MNCEHYECAFFNNAIITYVLLHQSIICMSNVGKPEFGKYTEWT